MQDFVQSKRGSLVACEASANIKFGAGVERGESGVVCHACLEPVQDCVHQLSLARLSKGASIRAHATHLSSACGRVYGSECVVVCPACVVDVKGRSPVRACRTAAQRMWRSASAGGLGSNVTEGIGYQLSLSNSAPTVPEQCPNSAPTMPRTVPHSKTWAL